MSVPPYGRSSASSWGWATAASSWGWGTASTWSRERALPHAAGARDGGECCATPATTDRTFGTRGETHGATDDDDGGGGATATSAKRCCRNDGRNSIKRKPRDGSGDATTSTGKGHGGRTSARAGSGERRTSTDAADACSTYGKPTAAAKDALSTFFLTDATSAHGGTSGCDDAHHAWTTAGRRARRV